ncbi:MAG: sugar phosphate isomerase/epimerase [Gemmataceae bacterium]|nr:sugar phosphate isomerase/epimerase [Gemmataceae bacterium]
MTGPWQPYLQLGVVHSMAFPECLGGDGPQYETLQQICHDPFFDAVDVGPINDAAVRRDCAKLLSDCQMTVTFACQPMILRHNLDLNAADLGQRRRAIDLVAGLFDQAKELGAGRIAVMSGKYVPERGAVGRFVDSLRELCRLAKERVGLPLMLEIFDWDVDKKALVGTCATAAFVAKEVRRDFPDFGLLHDLSHIYLCHETPAQHLPLIREYLVAVHMGSSVSDRNHPLYGDHHPLFGMPGGDSGVAELRGFVKTLFDIGFLRSGRRPICTFEVKPPLGVSSQTALANMKRTWQQAWWTL